MAKKKSNPKNTRSKFDESKKGAKQSENASRREEAAEAHFSLEAQATPEMKHSAKPRSQKGASVRAKSGDTTEILSYRHPNKRKNNPEVGMVKPENDPEQPKTVWRYDPHLAPALQFDTSRAAIEKLIDNALASGNDATMRAALQELKRLGEPYLNWSGKAERTSFEVDTVSLHVHERIEPATILSALSKRLKDAKGKDAGAWLQPDMFAAPFENLPLRYAYDFYKHERGWANRLIAGDSLLVMNSLIQKESMAGQVQMIYIDPPYGIKYGSNFQPFVNKRDVKDRKDEDLTQEPEMIKAFRDTWELGIHSYLTYLRDRLLLAKELLHESGSVFVQISDENVHHVRELMEEVFGNSNFVCEVILQKTTSSTTTLLPSVSDILVWYCKDKTKIRYRQLYNTKSAEGPADTDEFSTSDLTSQNPGSRYDVQFCGKTYRPEPGWWKTEESSFPRLIKAGRIVSTKNKIRYKRYVRDFPVIPLHNTWTDTAGDTSKIYVVQTTPKAIERCLLMTTDPGDLVLDPTCGSGTTAVVAEKWGRRWITCDTSRVSVTLAKQRLMTASFDYYELKYPQEGLKSGFIYETVPHVMLSSRRHPQIE